MLAARTGKPVARPGPRPSMSREAIVRATIRLLDREGAQSLTFRGVARELDVTCGALSRYFRNLHDLRDAVAAQILTKIRPLQAKSRRALRAELVRLGMDWLEITRSHPYLLAVEGPLSAVPIARHVGQNLAVLAECGVDLVRALTIYSMVTNLAFAWGVQLSRKRDPQLEATLLRELCEGSATLASQLPKLASMSGLDFHRRAFELLVDGLLP